MAGRRRVGKEPKGDVGEYSTIGVKNIICNNSREIKYFTKNKCTEEPLSALGYPELGLDFQDTLVSLKLP